MDQIRANADLVAAWLDGIDIKSAPQRIAAMQEDSLSKGTQSRAVPAWQIERAALHEAAHSVVACKLGLEVGRACVRADASGFAVYDVDEMQPESMLFEAIAGLAGVCFEILTWRVSRERQWQLQYSCDVLAARLSAEAFRALAPSWTLSNHTLVALAFYTVRSNLPQIERVASVIKHSGEIDGATVRALCGAPE